MANYCLVHDVQFVPHHDPQIHGHPVCAMRNGFGLETFPNKERDPLWNTLFSLKPEIKDCFVRLNEQPGLGFDIDWSRAKQFAA